jgi:hypothetical protein
MERVNDAIRGCIDRAIGVAAWMSNLYWSAQIRAYGTRQLRLRRQFGIDDSICVRPYDDETQRNIRSSRTAMYVYTSGSTDSPKRIAYDRKRLRRTLLIFADAMFRCLATYLPRNRTFFAMVPMTADRSLTSLLTRDPRAPFYISTLQAPHRIQNDCAIRDAIEIYGETAARLWMLTISNPGLIYSTNPSTIATFFHEVEHDWERSRRLVVDYVAGGTNCSSGLTRIHRRLASTGAALRLQAIAKSSVPLSAFELFPGLRAFCCWDGGYVRPFVEQIRIYLPESHYRQVPMYSMSTETIATIPIFADAKPEFLPVAPGILYEFVDDGGKVIKPKDLRRGRSYTMVVSDAYGLRRYDTDDVFECTAIVRGLPSLRFVRRRSLSYSFTGEKLTAEQLKLAYAAVDARFPEIQRNGFLTCFPFHPDRRGIPRYCVVWVQSSTFPSAAPTELAAIVERKVEECNSEYQSKIRTRRLGRMVSTTVGIREFVSYIVRSSAAVESQFKFIPLYTRLWDFSR